MSPVTISEHNDVRNLHFGTAWVQGAMRISMPDALELEYVRQMMAWTLFNRDPGHIVQLGLGAGALTKFCYRKFAVAQVTAVELNREVITVCEQMFALPPNDARLNVIEMDAMDYVMSSAHHGAVDILQVDLYDSRAQGPVLDTPLFYRACAACLKPGGIMTVNLFGERPSYGKNLQAIASAFEAVAWLPETDDGNIVAIAFRHAPQIDFTTLYDCAATIQNTMALPATSWVEGLETWMRNE